MASHTLPGVVGALVFGRRLTASPLGTALGGPLTTALGPRATLGGSGLATVVLGAVACVLLLAFRDPAGNHVRVKPS